MAKISIIIPIYNVEKYLKECLDSVINQTLKDIEIICINDGSPDNCLSIIEEYAKKDKRIKIINKENGGYGQALNFGFAAATGDYIGITEPDDFIKLDMYEKLYDIAKRTNVDIVKSAYYENSDNKSNKKIMKIGWDKEYNLPTTTFKIQEHPEFLFFHPSIWSCIYKREFIEKNNLKVVEAKGAGWSDNPFQVESLVKAERIFYTNEAFYFWRKQNRIESDDLKDYKIPFLRSNEIHEFLKTEKNITADMLACLYKRELAYIGIVLGIKNIKDKKDCFYQIKLMIERMDENVFKTSKYITRKDYKKYKRFKNNIKLAYAKAQFNNWRKRNISIRITKNETSVRIRNKKKRCKNMKKYDFGIVGLWYGLNYGSILTYYALNRFLDVNNKSVLMIECPFPSNKLECSDESHSRQFAKKHYEISEFKYISQFEDFNETCNGFILGSDQVFNPGICTRFKNTFFLSFADNSKKKIAYAGSFGHEDFKIKGIQKLKYQYFLNKFDGISVRETSGLTILKNRLDYTNAVHVVDPIFFQTENKFEELIREIEPIKERNYTLNYILDPTEDKIELIQKLAKTLNKKYINLLDGFTNKYEENKIKLNLDNTLPPIMTQEVLSYYKNSDFIVTDSFHGTCLAIIFRKPFIALTNKRRGIARFESLLKRLELTDRLFYDVESALKNINNLQEIDYNKVYQILNKDIEFSKNWLKEKIEEKKEIRNETLINKALNRFFDIDFILIKKLKLIKVNFSKLIAPQRKKEHYEQKIKRLKEEISLCLSDKNKYKGA